MDTNFVVNTFQFPSTDSVLYTKGFSTYSQHRSKGNPNSLLTQTTSCSNNNLFSRNVDGLFFVNFTKLFPLELTLKIFKYFSIYDLSNTYVVSSDWNYYSNHYLVWKNLCIQHINKKCQKCGWGLPPLLDLHCDQILIRKIQNNSNSSFNLWAKTQLQKDYELEVKMSMYWKNIYKERYLIENNWRMGRFKTQRIKISKTLLKINCLKSYKNLILVGGCDKNIRLFDMTKDYAEIQILQGHTMSVNCIQMDDCKLASGSDDGSVKFWCAKECIEVPKGKVLFRRSIEAKQNEILSLCFQNQILATGGTTGNIKIWDVQTGLYYTLNLPASQRHTFKFNKKDHSVKSVFIHQDLLISSYGDGAIRIFNLNTKECITELCDSQQSQFSGLCCKIHKNFNSHYFLKCSIPKLEQLINFITASTSGHIKTWDFNRCTKQALAHFEDITCIDSDFLRIATGGADKSIKIWDARTLKCYQTFFGMCGQASYVKVTDTKIIAACNEGYLYIWDFRL